MKRLVTIAALAALSMGLLVTSGCSTQTAGGHPTTGVWGYVAAAGDAQLEVSQDARADELEVDRVIAPGEAWIVVHLNDNGKPGKRVGLQHVDAGESDNVRVPLKDVTGDSLIVAVHADKGETGTFDFSMDSPTRSADRPYFVDGKELAVVVPVR